MLRVCDVGSLSVIGLFGCLSDGSSARLQAQRLLGAEDLSHPLVLVQVPRCLPTITLVHFGEDEPFSASPAPRLPNPAAISKPAYFDHPNPSIDVIDSCPLIHMTPKLLNRQAHPKRKAALNNIP